MKNDRNVDARCLELLRESDAIENITNINYELPRNRQLKKGHYGAFQESQRLAREYQPLNLEELCRWQGMITSDQLKYGHEIPLNAVAHLRSPNLPINVRVGEHVAPVFSEVPALMETFVADLNQQLATMKSSPNIVGIVSVLGDFFQRFEAIHPFVDGNGRTGRLLLNYIATWCKCPLIVVRLKDRPTFYPAHRSKKAMRLFMGEKIQEVAVNREGDLLPLVKQYEFSALYQDPAIPGQLIIEWHELIQAMDAWKSEIPN